MMNWFVTHSEWSNIIRYSEPEMTDLVVLKWVIDAIIMNLVFFKHLYQLTLV